MGGRVKGKAFYLLILGFVLSFVMVMVADARDIGQYEKQRQRILFVIDISNSMNYQDRNRLVNETVKMLIDTFDSSNTSAGFVTYNDAITSTYPITPIDEKRIRDEMKNQIDSVARTGNTDIGMAINTGMDMLLADAGGSERLTLVLISDGETDLTYTRTGRTIEDSKNDEALALKKAVENDCRIFTVGVSADGSLNTSYLDKLSNETNGQKYEVKNSQEIFDIFQDLYQNITDEAVINSGVLIGTGQMQTVNVDIPAAFITETNLVVMNNNQMQDVKVEYSSGGLNLYESNNYTSIKINDALNPSIQISFSGAKGDEIRVCTIHHLNFYPKVELPTQKEGQSVPITVRLYQLNDHSLIKDESLYNSVRADLTIVDPKDYQIEKAAMDNEGDRFTFLFPWPKDQPYSFVATVKNAAFQSRSQELKSEPVNTVPEAIDGATVRIYGKAAINLSEYFTDADADELTYVLVNKNSIGGDSLIDGAVLLLQDVAPGTYELEIRARDPYGASIINTIDYESISFYEYYKMQIVSGFIIVLLLIMALILLMLKRSSQGAVKDKGDIVPNYRFSRAKFEGYFYETASGNEIPVLIWNSGLVEDKASVSLGQLLKMMKVAEKLPEADSMLLSAGKNKTMVFSHQSEAFVTYRKYQVPPGEKVTLEYDDRLSILFEDGETELELRYKMSRSQQ